MKPRKRVEILVFTSMVAGSFGYGLAPRHAKLQALFAAIGRRPLLNLQRGGSC